MPLLMPLILRKLAVDFPSSEAFRLILKTPATMPPTSPERREKMAPTTREIALACGCNQSSVSRALRGNLKVSPERRAEIQRVARDMGWRANALASAYMAQIRTQRPPSYQATIGFLNTHPTSNRPGDWLMHQVRNLEGARQRAATLGFEVESFWLNEPGLTVRRLHGILRARGISGLIIPKRQSQSPALEAMTWERYAAVALEFSLSVPLMTRVATHSTHGFDLVFRKAAELGYRRIGVVVSEDYDRSLDHGVHFPMAYAREFWSARMGLEICRYDFAEPMPEAMPRIQRWLRETRPEMVLGEDIAWRAIQDMGWHVPTNVAFMNIDWSPEYPLIAGYNHRHDLQGAAAVDLVVGRLLQNDLGVPDVPRCLMIEGTWVDGPSAPPRVRHRTKLAVSSRKTQQK
jgi:LacI family transcriptional regulator